MKLWQKTTESNNRVIEFTVGRDRELDLLLAPFDILGSIAHATMLESIGLLSGAELEKLLPELRLLYAQAESGDFIIEDGVEDIHSQVELMLTRKLGETGKKIHSGRSRNDQVLLDLKLFMRQAILETVMETFYLFSRLQKLSEEHKDVLLPGYTHLQIAMPSSFGLWFGAYAESLTDDLIQMQAAYRLCNKNPLGSAAGYGSSFPLDREMTTDLLGFESMNYNVVYAQMGRGKTEKAVANALASIAATLGRMAMDICLYMSQNFGFMSFPDELTTGSSIMPHKKNPDVFEIIRARCNRMQSLPNELTLITANLPSGYHRDMQIVKECFLPAFKELNDCLQMSGFMLENIQVRKNILDDDKYKYLFTVESVNALTLDGMPFRDAYRQVGEEVSSGTYERPAELRHTHTGSLGNLANDMIRTEMLSIISSFGFERVEEAVWKLVG